VPRYWEENAYEGRNLFSFEQLQVDAAVKREAFPQRALTRGSGGAKLR